MSDRRVFRWATTSARLLIGTLVAAGAVVAVVTAVSLPWPVVARTPAVVVATPAPAASVLSCDGGILAVGRDVQNPGALVVAAPQDVTMGIPSGAPAPQTARLASPDLAESEGPDAFTAPPSGDARTDVAASGSASVRSADLSGFAASACRPPLAESWLVAGSGSTGAADLILLSNPGTVASTVQLTVYGATGPQNPPGGADLVVPAGSQRVVPLAGLALQEASPVIRVGATGAPVQASLQSSIVRVLAAGGVDQVGAVATADETLVIGGIAVVVAGGADAAGPATVLRLLSPSTDTTATVTMRRAGVQDGIASEISAPLAAGVPTEIELGGLSTGQYIASVAADAPVVAGLWQTTGFDGDADFAWYTPSPAVAMPTLFGVPSGPGPALTVVNPGDAPVTVAVSETDGAQAADFELAAGESRVVPLSARRVYLLDSGGAEVRAAVSFARTSGSGASALAGFPVWPADAAARPVTVYP